MRCGAPRASSRVDSRRGEIVSERGRRTATALVVVESANSDLNPREFDDADTIAPSGRWRR